MNVPVLPAGSATVATIVRVSGASATDGVTCQRWPGWTTVMSGVAPPMLTLTSVPATAVVPPTIVGVASLVELVGPPSIVMVGPSRSTTNSWVRVLMPVASVAVTITGCELSAKSRSVVAVQKVSFWAVVTVTPLPDPIVTVIAEPDSTVPVTTGVLSFVRALLVIAKTVSTVRT